MCDKDKDVRAVNNTSLQNNIFLHDKTERDQKLKTDTVMDMLLSFQRRARRKGREVMQQDKSVSSLSALVNRLTSSYSMI